MNKELVNNCSECKQNCCSHGTGPFKLLTPEQYLENFGTPDAYNTKCAALTPENKCSLWGTADLPIECRTHVCTNKVFTNEELEVINLVEEKPCENCGASYVISYEIDDRGGFVEECEHCDHVVRWTKRKLRR